MEERTRVVSGGIGLGGVVFVVFLVLKLLDNAGALNGDFSWLTWFWVFFPLWIGAAVGLGLLIFIGIIMVALAAIFGR